MGKIVLPQGFKSRNYKQEYATQILKEFAALKNVIFADESAIAEARYFPSHQKNGWFMEGIVKTKNDFNVVYPVLFMESGIKTIFYDIKKSIILNDTIVVYFGKDQLQLFKNETQNGYSYEPKKKIKDENAFY